jgi:CRISPR system Cascade subunit CasD
MQSWGLRARGPNRAHRHTHVRPSKSGVIGLVANALGRDFNDSVADLARLQFGVRVDRRGSVEFDYHTAGSGSVALLPGQVYADARWARNSRSYTPGSDFEVPHSAPADVRRGHGGELSARTGNTVITVDRYLADASFLAALSGPAQLVDEVGHSLEYPARSLYLGRRAFLPATPVAAGVVDDDLIAALVHAPLSERSDSDGQVAMWLEPADSEEASRYGASVIADQPVAFSHPPVRSARLEYHLIVERESP